MVGQGGGVMMAQDLNSANGTLCSAAVKLLLGNSREVREVGGKGERRKVLRDNTLVQSRVSDLGYNRRVSSRVPPLLSPLLHHKASWLQAQHAIHLA